MTCVSQVIRSISAARSPAFRQGERGPAAHRAGTLYVGRRMAVGVLAAIGRTVALSAEISVSPPGSNAIPSVWPFLLGGLNVLKLGLALDANREAQLANG